MFNCVIIISECIGKYENGNFKFHFKGFVKGRKISNLNIFFSKNSEFVKKGESYIILVRITKIQNNILCGVCLKHCSLVQLREDNDFISNLLNSNLEYEH